MLCTRCVIDSYNVAICIASPLARFAAFFIMQILTGHACSAAALQGCDNDGATCYTWRRKYKDPYNTCLACCKVQTYITRESSLCAACFAKHVEAAGRVPCKGQKCIAAYRACKMAQEEFSSSVGESATVASTSGPAWQPPAASSTFASAPAWQPPPPPFPPPPTRGSDPFAAAMQPPRLPSAPHSRPTAAIEDVHDQDLKMAMKDMSAKIDKLIDTFVDVRDMVAVLSTNVQNLQHAMDEAGSKIAEGQWRRASPRCSNEAGSITV